MNGGKKHINMMPRSIDVLFPTVVSTRGTISNAKRAGRPTFPEERVSLDYHATVGGTFAANNRFYTRIAFRPSVGCLLLIFYLQGTPTTYNAALHNDQHEETYDFCALALTLTYRPTITLVTDELGQVHR